MGFECRSEMDLRAGRWAKNSESAVGIVEGAECAKICKPQRGLFR
jgi:hypothetical protein